MVTLKNTVEEFIDNIQNIQKDFLLKFSENKDITNIADNEILDLLHEIRETNFNAARGYYLAKELQIVENRRKAAKHENELMEDLVQLFSSPELKNINNKLEQIKGKSRKLHRDMDNRYYVARVRKDLSCAKHIRDENKATSLVGGHKFNIEKENEISNGVGKQDVNKLIKEFKQNDKVKKQFKYG